MADRTDTKADGFTAEERAAMKDRAAELKAAKRGAKKNPEADLLAKIDELSGDDRQLAERIHALVMKTAPQLEPKTWYGMPAWARDGKIVCFFQPATKFKSRYATFGFNEDAKLDEGPIWATAFAVTAWNGTVEKQIAALVSKAVG